MSEKIKLIAVVGPTAVGKTALGIELAQQFNGEVISGDNQQVYRHLSIGTAKATPEEQAAAPHHLIDVHDVDTNYSVYNFVVEASQAITEIASRGKVPIIVGGTDLYLQNLLEGYHLGGEVDQEKVLAYRRTLEQLSNEVLFGKITELGKEISEINRRRAIRTLELAKFGQNLENKETNYRALLIGLNDDRQVLYDRINHRVDLMLEKGILDEAKWLYDNHRNAQAARAIGYKELFPYFTGSASLEDCVKKLKQNTHHFAKRQLAWFRNRMTVNFYNVSEVDFRETVIQDVNEFLR